MYLHITSKLASSLVFSSALLFDDYHPLIGRWVSKLGFLMWKIFPRISICSNFCLLRMSALPPERSHKKAENREKEAPTFREQLFSHKLPFCPYKQKLLVRQNLKELSYSGKTIAFKHLNIINVYLKKIIKQMIIQFHKSNFLFYSEHTICPPMCSAFFFSQFQRIFEYQICQIQQRVWFLSQLC